MFLHDAVEMFDVYITPITWLHLSVCVNKYLRKTNQFDASLASPHLCLELFKHQRPQLCKRNIVSKMTKHFPYNKYST